MKVLRFLYTSYGVLVFFLLFLIFFFLLLIPIFFSSTYKLTGIFNRWWARLLFFFIALPYKVVYESKLDGKKQYIFCPNHFSYIDIPSMGLNHHNTIFVGKSEINKVPVFGYMYSKLHITVDRTKLKSRYTTLVKTKEALDEGKSLVVFPEGGIVTEKEPVMGKFKDGPFRVSIEKQIPIVPVTIPYNWIILPPNEFLLNWKPMKVIFHRPIDPSKYTLDTIDEYKEYVRSVLQEELTRHLNK
ncbi:lysophospholipid acyltransferase family protein [Chryseosolibacter indicus]|uniref:1-acyl-sn-glycerol-3-phosphate acyltransferase n=1 Tax=Chryseosolibacter indicus TaxID=2782351 RepID=A0ABS5VL23_9BACT|nr:lysophospholipid acyltransferase family protein [Chryseosolibacter indicus]MBT1702148.1 1-acyl-sn-glycerol-3-phosphate acyltransferase [Chryseosolibacter indicus]